MHQNISKERRGNYNNGGGPRIFMITTIDFRDIQAACVKQLDNMCKDKQPLFVVDVPGDVLWQTYLDAFPPHERQAHNCMACRQFIKKAGGLVKPDENYNLISMWNVTVPGYLQGVVDKLNALVTEARIRDTFLLDRSELTVGHASDLQRLEDGSTIKWHHLYYKFPTAYASSDVNGSQSDARNRAAGLKRDLEMISIDSVNTVLELINQGALYRGNEFKPLLTKFLALQEANRLNHLRNPNFTKEQHETFCWVMSAKFSHIRNTAIGTLLTDISEGRDLDKAVTSYESKVAPENYRRPTAIVTENMKARARADFLAMGFSQTSLERRQATIDDVPIDQWLYVDRLPTTIENDFFNNMLVVANPRITQQDISFSEFFSSVVPHITSMEILFEDELINNLVTMTAPVDTDTPSFFQWPNGMGWSYNNQLADSSRQRVKAAGGKIDGALCCRLMWYNTDDLDLHLEFNGNRIYYGSKKACGGELDVDANARTSSLTNTPVENIAFANKAPNAKYLLSVNQFNRRNSADIGFQVDIETEGGQFYTFTYETLMPTGKTVNVARFSMVNGVLKLDTDSDFLKPSSATGRSLTTWGMGTNQWQKVRLITTSPNHWGDTQRGNLHFFIFLDKAVPEGPIRPFFNEFIRADLLLDHRRVFELLGSMVPVNSTPNGLAGLGFSSTTRASFTCRVGDSSTRKRIFKVTF